MISFQNQTALITGGTRGIGRSVAMQLAKLGCRVIITGTSSVVPEGWAERDYIALDLSDENSITKFQLELDQLGSVDVLINNAGINVVESIEQISMHNWNKILQVNLTGALVLTKMVAPVMQKKRYGRIVNVSSIWGVASREGRHAYSASKSGLIGLTRSSALDLAKSNVLVNAVCPGFTNTEMTCSILSEVERRELAKSVPLRRFAEVDEIAKAIIFLSSNWNSYITGQAIVVDGGYTIT